VLRGAILNDYQHVALAMGEWERLGSAVSFDVFHNPFANESETISALRPFDVVCTVRERTPFPRRVLERLPNLKLIASAGFRNAVIDLQAARDLGITICGRRPLDPAAYGYATATLALGLILELARSVGAESQGLKAGTAWQSRVGLDLHERTIGLLGLGRLGARVATMVKPLGMRIIAWSENLTRERCEEIGVEYASKQELLETSDIVSIHMVLTDRTANLIGAPELARMKPTSFLINTSRGPIVDEAALIVALRERRIAGAGLDVFTVEPLPLDHPFRRMDNVVITPHIGFVTDRSYRAMFGDMVVNIERWLAGEPTYPLEPHPSQV
jgi:D-3-phosphoglycerate dehydrogenase